MPYIILRDHCTVNFHKFSLIEKHKLSLNLKSVLSLENRYQTNCLALSVSNTYPCLSVRAGARGN